MNIAKRKRCQNTTSEQYEEYVKLMETDDIFRSGKLTPTISPNYILESWDNLTNKLNAIGTGPVLSSKEWAKRLGDWKNAARAKYRKIAASRLKTGGGVGEEIKLSALEDRGLAVWGKVVVTGSPEALVVAGLQQQRKNHSPQPGCSGDDNRISDEHISLDNEIKEATTMFEKENSPEQTVHAAGVTQAAILDCDFQQIDHPPYSPNIAPSGYYLFGYLKKDLCGRRFNDDNELKAAVVAHFDDKPKHFFLKDIELLIKICNKCTEAKGDYIEK
ncbi:hypothetical protein GEV33_004782 [Tenebrio molitor]|uniref:Regulatory protein zeste n=1 Tax=Tenebrio molitor TaxID=7067 RepID=A0A8J6HNQ5_TENMO|nr:hypothetical protein GEV33_004782 [Tenebrio molitor]